MTIRISSRLKQAVKATPPPNAIRLAPGKSGEIVWKFTNDGVFKIACLVPGHYDSGMHGDVTVAKK
ncbi:hypothetical protein FLX27_30690, partial [Agrobacterium tumefaciens]